MPTAVKYGKLFMKDANGNLVQIVPESNASISNYTGATSSAAGVAGLVPAATSAQRESFLRGDGTWAEAASPVSEYVGATENANGTSGLVPAAQSSQKEKFLRGDGTWQEVATDSQPYIVTMNDPAIDQSCLLETTGIIFYIPENNAYIWKATVSVGNSRSIPIPFCLYNTTDASIEVNWGDGIIETFTSSIAEEDVFPTHTYSVEGTYTISIKSNTWDKIYITDCRTLDLDLWKISLVQIVNPLPALAGTHTCGDSYTSWEHIPNVLQYTFFECSNLTSIPENLYINNPNVASLSHAFAGCTSLTTIPQRLLAYPTEVSNLNNFMSLYWASGTMSLGSFNIDILSPNVSDAAGFTDAKNNVERIINLPSNSTTATTFNEMASNYGYDISLIENSGA